MIRPDYYIAEYSAHRLLEQFKLNELPVNLESVFDSFSNLKIKTYSWFASQNNITLEDVIEITDSESGCCWYMPEKSRYLILYNDTIPNQGHVRWTIAHELGHYLLKHNEKSERTILHRNSLSKAEYAVFEKEANCFARSLLAPSSVLAAIGRLDVVLISNMCHISFEAASNVMRFLKKGIEMGKVVTEHRLTVLFRKTIFSHVHAHTCMNCRFVFANEICFNCPVCGSDSIIRGRSYNFMKYPGFEVDENSRLKECALCKNEEIGHDDEFCKVCASPVVNKCTNADYDINGYIEWKCDALADGNARFCINCGVETVFFKKGLLKPWDKVMTEKDADQRIEYHMLFADTQQ